MMYNRYIIMVMIEALMSGMMDVAEGAPVVRRQQFNTVDNSGSAEVQPPADHTKLNLGLGITFGLMLLVLGVVIGGRAWQRSEEHLKISRAILEQTQQQTQIQGKGVDLQGEDLKLKQEDTEFKRQELGLKSKSVGMRADYMMSGAGSILGSPASALRPFAGVETHTALSAVPSRDAPSGVGAPAHDALGSGHNDDVSVLDVNSPSYKPHSMRMSTEKP